MKPSKFADWVIRFRWVHIVVFLAITGVFAAHLTDAQLDTEMKNQLPRDLPTRVNLDRIEKLFGGTDMVMIVMASDDIVRASTLERMKKLSAEMATVDGLERIISPFTAKDLHGTDGDMVVEQAIMRIPDTPKGEMDLRARLKANPLVYGNLVSKDFRYAVLIGFMKPGASDDAVVGKLRALIKSVSGPEKAYVGGMPVTRVSLTQDMRKDMRRFLPIGLLIMLVFLLMCFRQARGVILPFVMTVMAIIVAMGLIPILGWRIHTVTILLPVILLAVANDYGIHIMARYQEDNAPGSQLGSKELVKLGIVELTRPILATGITTMVGVLCLATHIIIPAKQLGVLAAVGVGFAMVGSLVFIPAVLSLLPKAKPVLTVKDTKTGGSRSLIDGMLLLFARGVARRPRTILLVSILTTLAMGAGSALVIVDTNPMSFYRRTEPVWQSTNLLNEHLGGWAGISVIAEGDIKDPKVLHEIDDFEQHLKKNPLIGTTTSIAGVMRKMNQVMHDGDPKFDTVPESRELVAQYLLLYSMSGDAQDFEKLVDFPYRHAQIMAKVTDSGTTAATAIMDDTHAYLAAHPGSSLKLAGGFLDVMADMVHHIVWGQVVSMGLAALLVGVVVALLLRSWVVGALAVFPLALALMMIFGIMGFAGIELNLVTALLSSIMLGVGVDYSIHFLWRYRDERTAGLEPAAAIERTLTTTGRGIVFNAFSVVVGFAVLVISAFFPVRFFGLMVAISILASLVGALVVLPALVLTLRPKYFEPSSPSPSEA